MHLPSAPSSLLASLAIAAAAVGGARGHTMEIWHCITPEGNMRFLAEHWHQIGWPLKNPCCENPAEAGVMTMRTTGHGAHQTTENTNLAAAGVYSNLPVHPDVWQDGTVASESLARFNCRSNELPVKIAGCGYDELDQNQQGQMFYREPQVHSASEWEKRPLTNWAYFEVPVTCNTEVNYQFDLTGDNKIMRPGVSGMYPASTGRQEYADTSPPVPKVGGENLPQTLTVLARSREDATAVVDFAAGAADDCDPAPAFVTSHASGSVFPVGTTVVDVTATDNLGKTATGHLTVVVTENREAHVHVPMLT